MATRTAVTMEEYLNTSYHPDVEYIDGDLREKPVVGFPPGETQVILGAWFCNHRREWGIKVAVETRTKTSESHVRLPDVVVVSRQERSKGTLEAPPLIAIEIDPEERTGEVWTGQNWQRVGGSRLEAVDSPMFVDLDWLWAEMDE